VSGHRQSLATLATNSETLVLTHPTPAAASSVSEQANESALMTTQSVVSGATISSRTPEHVQPIPMSLSRASSPAAAASPATASVLLPSVSGLAVTRILLRDCSAFSKARQRISFKNNIVELNGVLKIAPGTPTVIQAVGMGVASVHCSLFVIY
jgi:hypothetical protein